MASVSLDELQKKIPSKFGLVMIAAKRARQIKDGAPKLVATASVNPVTIALEEISSGKILIEENRARVADDVVEQLPPARRAPVGDLLALPEEEAEEDAPATGSDALEAFLRGIQSANLDDEAGGAQDADIDVSTE